MSSKSPKISEHYQALDADIIFKSSDNILFHVHRKNLENNAASFPPSTKGEIVPLPDDASTLDTLFQYMYDSLPEPDLKELPSEILYNLAEAAERYTVYYVQVICNERIKELVAQYPAETFNYASKYDRELQTTAAQALLDLPLDKAVTKLSPHLIVPWVRYRESWSRVAFSVLSSPVRCPRNCADAPIAVPNAHKIWFELGEKRSRKAIYEVMSTLQCQCGCNLLHKEFAPLVLRQILEQDMDEIPNFRHFLVA
ncbi:hypothetical protein H0H87_006127 [Tephrocybe sp. NHM501043]|nr:hypothetical protein H0H87_006127 [Tephrocybe sp. NHM501043]